MSSKSKEYSIQALQAFYRGGFKKWIYPLFFRRRSKSTKIKIKKALKRS